MYDILQLNDMLVPELLDIAEQLKIPNAKKLGKQDLVYKILDSQAVTASEKKGNPSDDKGKRKRIIKTSTGITTEEAIVEENNNNDNKMTKPIRPAGGKPAPRKEEKPILKKGRKKGDEEMVEHVAEVLTTEENGNDGQPDEDQETGQTEMVASESESSVSETSVQQKIY